MEEENVFSEAPIGKAVRTMIFPTIISQIIMVIYNMADTWYVGLTGNAYAVAAVSLCLPVYSILSAVSNLFGIGGAGAMARALGVHDRKRAGKVVGMTLLGAMAGAVLYAWFMAAAARPLLILIEGDDHTIAYAVSYTFWTIVVGGIPTILSPVCGHLIRAMGRGLWPFILSVLHKGSLDILLLFVIRETLGTERLVWAALISELTALVVGIGMLSSIRNKKTNRKTPG